MSKSDASQENLENKHPGARAFRKEGSLAGERRVVTILFCDVAGSTRMAETLDPEDWAEIMDSAFEHMIPPIFRYEGTLARLMGDAILALFGAPTSHEDDPQRALLASLDILQDLRPFQAQVLNDFGLDFKVRIGINTGTVVVGEVGSDQAGEYTAMGDAVNLASRLQETADPGTIQVSESTYKQTAPLFVFESLGVKGIEGRTMGLHTYRLVNTRERPGNLRGLKGLASPIVGRSSEIRRLEKVFEELHLGRGGIVSLIGEAGLGKTRLIDEFRTRWASFQAEARDEPKGLHYPGWSEARGISYDKTRPYSLFIDNLRKLLRIQSDDIPAASRKKIAEFVERFPTPEHGMFTKALEALLGLEEIGETGIGGEALKRQINSIMIAQWREAALLGPAVAIFDDLHWADPASVEVLQNLFQLVNEVPLLILFSMRPDRRSPGWHLRLTAETDYPHRYTEVWLNPLTVQDSASLVENLLAIADLPEQVRQLILEKAEGNPFFIEEVIRTLMEDEVIAPAEGGSRWIALKQVEEIEIPDNLQALIIARIDRLSSPERKTLQLASVLGRNFSAQVLSHIDPVPEDISARLNNLERMGLITEHSRQPALEYRFVHELTRDAAYQSILRRQRREYHRLAGNAIETLFAGRIEEEAHRLAYHFDQGRDRARALHYYRTAAEAAAHIFANEEAVDDYNRAIALGNQLKMDADELAPMYLRRGRILEESSRFKEAIQNYQELEEIAREHGNRMIEAGAMIAQMTNYVTPTSEINEEKGRELGQRILEVARETDDPQIKAKGLWNLMLLEQNILRNHQRSIELGEESLKIARTHDLKETLAFTLHDLSRAYQSANQIEDALDAVLEANTLFRSLNFHAMIADNLTLTAEIYFRLGELEKARQYGEEALALGQKTGSLWGQGYSAFSLAPIYIELAELETGIRTLEESMTFWSSANFVDDFYVYGCWILSWGYALVGDRDKAFQYADILGSSISEMSGDNPNKSVLDQASKLTDGYLHYISRDFQRARQVLGEIPGQDAWFFHFPQPIPTLLASIICDIALAAEDYQSAMDLAEVAMQKARISHSRPYMSDLLLDKGDILIQLGQAENGWRHLTMALEEAESIQSRRAILKILLRMSTLEISRGNETEASDFQARARKIVQEIAGNIADRSMREKFLSSRIGEITIS